MQAKQPEPYVTFIQKVFFFRRTFLTFLRKVQNYPGTYSNRTSTLNKYIIFLNLILGICMGLLSKTSKSSQTNFPKRSMHFAWL